MSGPSQLEIIPVASDLFVWLDSFSQLVYIYLWTLEYNNKAMFLKFESKLLGLNLDTKKI